MIHYVDLQGGVIIDGDWYYAIHGGKVVPHCFVAGWPEDEARLATGRVLKMPTDMTPGEAGDVFKKAGIRNTVET